MSKIITFAVVATVLLKSAICQPQADSASCMHGNSKTIKDCCQFPSFVDQSIMNRCATENPTIAPAPGVKKTEGCCIAQCLMTTLNTFKNNTIDKTALKRALSTSNIGSDRNFGPLINSTVDECVNIVSTNPAFKATPVSSTPGRAACSFMPEGFFNCFKSTLFQRCPAAVWTDSTDCKQLKQKSISGCSFVALMG
ncbi:general odorant-binding protein 67-like [Topomyia yanbarensis]|uniref:general odorant-binding protein 67-like n=1 Tax=Topomyia yanbarensis TaxID=2498891 RepID=UPI00273C557F|nr:general odorant-binding protein 67-like [Topomyia yanbarensis]